MKTLYVVRACELLSEAEVKATIAPLQIQIDRDFMKYWGNKIIENQIKVEYANISDIKNLPGDSWPVFLNRHSNDLDALGWHDDDPAQNIRIYSRVFVGDCLQLNLNWQTTLSHEALELILDPDIRRVYKMSNGRLAAFEACDAVEADEQAYEIEDFLASDFVLPEYFSNSKSGPFDFRSHLSLPCPSLTPGGYMSITDASGNWNQINMDQQSGLIGKRAMMNGHRRQARSIIPLSELRIET
jgi:hypothetical protein